LAALLVAAILAGMLSFLGLGLLLKIEEAHQMAGFVRERFRVVTTDADDFQG